MTDNTTTRRPLAPIALAAIVVACLVLGALYAVYTPPWQVPDEPAHYNYVRYVVEQRRLPVLQPGDYDQAYLNEILDAKFDPAYSIDPIRYEYHQPPLYYLLLAPVYALSGGALLPLRMVSVLLGAGIAVVAYLTARRAYPGRVGLALGAAAFVAFIPQHLAMNAGVQNDPLAELILGLALLRLVSWLRTDEPWSIAQHVVTGAIIGLGLLTKLSAYVAVPLAVVAVVLKYWRTGRAADQQTGKSSTAPPTAGPDVRDRPFAAALPVLAALLLPALLLGLPWFVRNAVVYGGLDFTGLGRHAEVVQGQLTTAQWIELYGWGQLPGAFVRTTFRSFWGQFGWMAVPMEWRVYLALRVFSILAAVGVVFRAVDAWDKGHRPSAALVLLFFSGMLTLGSYLWYNLSFYQAQGRYLFPALIPIGVAWTLGMGESLRRRSAPWLAGVLALVTAYDLFLVFVRNAGEKWAALIHGAGTAYVGAGWAVGFLSLDRLRPWLLSVPYLFVAALGAVSPFWFIVPNLSP